MTLQRQGPPGEPPPKRPDVWIKAIKRNRGAPRLYLDSLQAVRTGFSPGENYDVEVAGRRLVLRKKRDGSRTVSVRRKGDRDFPVLDINSAELLAIFEGMDAVRVVVSEGMVTFLPLASESRRLERLERVTTRLAEGKPLRTGSLAHGGGILSHAIHTGLAAAGIESELAFANELRDDLVEQAASQNDAWSPGTGALAVPMQELAQDEWVLKNLDKIELLEAGLPCSGASLAGHTRNALTEMEDHEQVGHLAFSALLIIDRLQPAIVVLENVPRYASTASAKILRRQLQDMGFNCHEAILRGKDHGCLEDRERWCMVAVTRGMEFSFEQLAPTVRVVRTVGELLDPQIGPEDARWREVQYLKDKEERNALSGDRFKMQFIESDSSSVPTLRKGYHKGGSSDPRLRHPEDPTLSRLLTAQEHSRIKGVPPGLIQGLSETVAHQLLGQGIVYAPFAAVGRRIGESLLEFSTREHTGENEADAEPSQALVRRERATG